MRPSGMPGWAAGRRKGRVKRMGRAMLARSDLAGAATVLAEGAGLAEAGQDRFALAHALHWLARAQSGAEAAATDARAMALFSELGVNPPDGG